MNDIQWYPGHMAKTRRMISENLKLCDITVEILDARIPRSSKNPILDELLGDRPRLVLLNKSDISDPDANDAWISYYREKKVKAMLFSAIHPSGNKELLAVVRSMLKDKIERQKSRGILNRAIKIMVVGVPNVGKSAFINCLSGRATMKVENRPGVTRDKQWIKLPGGFELLDTPGILWPKLGDPVTGSNLAFCGAVKDEIMDLPSLAVSLISVLGTNYQKELSSRYKLDAEEFLSGNSADVLNMIAKKRGFLLGGGEVDLERTARTVLDEFRSAKIGRITLEFPEDGQ